MTEIKVKEYSLGFMFDYWHHNVLLIKKTKPDFQAGRYNGVGGKYDPSSDSAKHIEDAMMNCMIREFREETGADTVPNDWNKIGTLGGGFDEAYEHAQPWLVHVYKSTCLETVQPYMNFERRPDEEYIEVIKVRELPFISDSEIMPNLRWLIPLIIYNPEAFVDCRY